MDQQNQLRIPETFANFFLGRLANRTFYQPKLQSTLKQRKDILNYSFQKNLLQIISLQQNPIKKYLSRPEFERIQTKEDLLKNLKIKKKNLEAQLEKQRYLQTKNKCLFVNEMAFQLSHSRYVSMAYGVLIGSVINMTLLRYQHGVRRSFVMVLLAHFMGQMSVIKRQRISFDYLYPIYEKYDKEDVELMIKEKK